MSTARFNTLQNAAGSKSVPVDTVVDGSAKAWVNFNGTGTVAIRASFNVSSITDNGTGNYLVNFTTAMPDANYAAVVTINSDNPVSARTHDAAVARTSSFVAVQCLSISFSVIDSNIVAVAIFR